MVKVFNRGRGDTSKYENVQVLGELKTDAVLYYVHRTLQVLDGLSLDEEAYRIIEKV